ncbi:unnamed protein product [Clonostachys rosea]|uniref:Uncharacterized protein n=1 Tax=Bionectria ochroleuca TaxID=29856 RepID=A0ABY6UAI7_BIOOC|nr:unnamed protein product [Clonostachys rosea]
MYTPPEKRLLESQAFDAYAGRAQGLAAGASSEANMHPLSSAVYRGHSPEDAAPAARASTIQIASTGSALIEERTDHQIDSSHRRITDCVPASAGAYGVVERCKMADMKDTISKETDDRIIHENIDFDLVKRIGKLTLFPKKNNRASGVNHDPFEDESEERMKNRALGKELKKKTLKERFSEQVKKLWGKMEKTTKEKINREPVKTKKNEEEGGGGKEIIDYRDKKEKNETTFDNGGHKTQDQNEEEKHKAKVIEKPLTTKLEPGETYRGRIVRSISFAAPGAVNRANLTNLVVCGYTYHFESDFETDYTSSPNSSSNSSSSLLSGLPPSDSYHSSSYGTSSESDTDSSSSSGSDTDSSLSSESTTDDSSSSGSDDDSSSGSENDSSSDLDSSSSEGDSINSLSNNWGTSDGGFNTITDTSDLEGSVSSSDPGEEVLISPGEPIIEQETSGFGFATEGAVPADANIAVEDDIVGRGPTGLSAHEPNRPLPNDAPPTRPETGQSIVSQTDASGNGTPGVSKSTDEQGELGSSPGSGTTISVLLERVSGLTMTGMTMARLAKEGMKGTVKEIMEEKTAMG